MSKFLKILFLVSLCGSTLMVLVDYKFPCQQEFSHTLSFFMNIFIFSFFQFLLYGATILFLIQTPLGHNVRLWFHGKIKLQEIWNINGGIISSSFKVQNIC